MFRGSRLLLSLSIAVPMIWAGTSTARATVIVRGYDLLETDTGTTYQDLSLPPGFFGPGSDPFVGRVVFQGVPFDTFDPDGPGPAPLFAGLHPTDTVVRRMADAGPAFPVTVPIEIVALHLVSANPITVTYLGGFNPEPWQLNADISVNPATGLVNPPQAPGTMTLRHEQTNGGTFDSVLPVQPLLTFRRQNPPAVIGPVIAPFTIQFQALRTPWCHAANPLMFPFGHVGVEIAGVSTNFFPSVFCQNAQPDLPPVSYSVDGGAFNPARNGLPLTPAPNPAEGRFQPLAAHLPPNDVYALGTAPGASGYATEGEVFQSAGAPLGAPPNTTNVDRMSAALGVGPVPAGPPFVGPFAPNPGAPAAAPAPPGVAGPPGSFGPPPGNTVGTLGLVPNDNVDALSYGRDSGNVLLFSVDPASVGAPFSAVRAQAVVSPFGGAAAPPLPTNPGGGNPGGEAAGDIFKSVQLLNFGSYIGLHFANGVFLAPAFLAPNALVYDELQLGLQAPSLNGSALGPPEDDLDGLEMADSGDPVFGVDVTGPLAPGPDGIPDRFVFFSLDTASPSNGLALGGFVSSPDDILVTPPGGFSFGIFADGVADIGLLAGDDIDALALSDVRTLGKLDPGADEALFSFHRGSPNVLVGCDGVAGTGDEVSPADVFYTNFTVPFCPGPPLPYASAAVLGLRFKDNVDALDIQPAIVHPHPVPPPTPPPTPLKKLTREQQMLAQHGIRISEKRRYTMVTDGTFDVQLFVFGAVTANVSGPTEVVRLAEQVDPSTLQSTIPIEIVSMSLTGVTVPGGLQVKVSAGASLGLPASLGAVHGAGPGQFFPADSFFDVFVKIDIPAAGMQLRNHEPFRVHALIDALPPLGQDFVGFQPVQLFDQNGNPQGVLVRARHTPRCQSNADCDDDWDPCTADTCSVSSGVCTHTPLPDSDGDGVCDVADNCPNLGNPGGQAPTVFAHPILAPNKLQFCWGVSLQVDWVQGNLGLVSSYGTNSMTSALAAACFNDPTVPPPGKGLYYLVRDGCAAGSWQSVLGAEPGRDVALP